MKLYTKRLVLRPWSEDDAEQLYEYAKNPAVGPIAGWAVHPTVEYSRTVIRTILSAPECYAVCFRADGLLAGCAGFSLGESGGRNLPPDEGELGYWLGVPYWGRGLIPEACGELLRHAFEDLHFRRVWCGYFEGNDNSRRVQEKLGFRLHHITPPEFRESLGEERREIISCIEREDWLTANGI